MSRQRGRVVLTKRYLRTAVFASILLGWGLLWGPGIPGIAGAVAKPLSDRDVKQFQAALKAADLKRWKKAERMARRIRDPLPHKIIHWMNILRPSSSVSFQTIAHFIEKNPNWPRHKRLRQRAEGIMGNKLEPQEILAWFKKFPPVSTDGRAQVAGAMLATGRTEKAHAMIRYLWLHGNFSGKGKEKKFYRRYKKIITAKDNIARLDRLLWSGRYWPARRMLWKVDKDYRALSFARLQLRFRRGNVDRAIAIVPEHLKKDMGLAYERLRWRRKKGKTEAAVNLLDKLPDVLPYPKKWWNERAILARRSLQKGYITQAYRVANGGQFKKGTKYAESTWLAGWIAHRFLKDHKTAKKHFTQMYDRVKYPVSRARAAYWAGRAAESIIETKKTSKKVNKKKKDKKETLTEAQKWFQKAAQYPTVYYGQLAALKLPKDKHQLALPPEPKIDKKKIKKYAKHELVRAVRILIQAGRKKHTRRFIMALYRMKSTPSWRAMTAALAKIYNRPDIGILVAKHSLREDGRILADSGYPALVPPFLHNGDRKILEIPLVLSVIRQESAFNPEAKSHAGARGLMQLMPATASNLAKRMKISYTRNRLTADPAYNLKLGQTYLLELLQKFNGSYVLSVAGYNAGPHRVTRWLKENGNPREQNVDAIDWIEMIPYSETRNYVQRVMENLQVYRHRLAKSPVQIELEKDLVR